MRPTLRCVVVHALEFGARLLNRDIPVAGFRGACRDGKKLLEGIGIDVVPGMENPCRFFRMKSAYTTSSELSIDGRDAERESRANDDIEIAGVDMRRYDLSGFLVR